MWSPLNKVMNLIDKLPQEERMIIAKAYYIKDEKEMSPKVLKLKKVYDKLSNDERTEFITYIWARKLDDSTDAAPEMEMEVEVTSSENEKDLSE